MALLREDDGTPIHFIGQILDITEQYEFRRKLALAQATIDQQRRRTEAVYDTVDVGLVLLDAEGDYETVNRRHRDFMRLAYPDGHHGKAGQPGEVYVEGATTLLELEQMPTYRAVRGEELDDVRKWIGSDPVTRRALSVSARSVRDHAGQFAGAALAYKDVTDYVEALTVKDEFVASVSHELRTPMTSILGHFELLVGDPSLPDGVTKRIKTVERNAVRLRQLESDLLEVQQDTASGMVLDKRDCDLVEIVNDAVDAARPWAESSGLTMTAHLPDSLIAHVDPGRIRQVVYNLHFNDINCNQPGGHVEVTLCLSADDVNLAAPRTPGSAPFKQTTLTCPLAFTVVVTVKYDISKEQDWNSPPFRELLKRTRILHNRRHATSRASSDCRVHELRTGRTIRRVVKK